MFRKGTRCRRQSFTLRERLLERRETFAGELHARVEIFTLAHRSACGGIGVVGDATKLGRRRPARRALHLAELGTKLGEQALRRLVPDTEALGRAAQRKQRVASATRK